MKNFWTCGPFKETQDKMEMMAYKAEQMKIFMDTLEELKRIEEIIQDGSQEEKIIASMMKLDVDKKLKILIGVPDGYEEENDEIFGKAILESLKGNTESKTE